MSNNDLPSSFQTHRFIKTSVVLKFFAILRIPPFVNHRGKDVNSDWLADQWDERCVFGHAQFHKGSIKVDDPEIDTALTPKRLDGCLALLEKIRKTFTDKILNKKSDLIATNQICKRLPLIISELNSSSEHGFALSYTVHLFFVSSALEHRLCEFVLSKDYRRDTRDLATICR